MKKPLPPISVGSRAPLQDGMRQPPAPPFIFPSQPNYDFLRKAETVVAAEGSRPSQIPGSPAAGAMSFGQETGPPGMGDPGPVVRIPGGNLLTQFQHPTFTTVEQLYRVLPDDSFYSPSLRPNKPVQFELGAFTIPDNQEFWLYNYQFRVFRLSGFDAGDFLPAEEGRFTGVMGFDVAVQNKRTSSLLYQLDPVPIQVQRQTYDQPPNARANAAQFNRSAAQSFAANSSQGLSLLPVRSQRQGNGPEIGPFTMIAHQGDKVALSCVIFKTVPSPIAFIEASMTGYLIGSNIGSALTHRQRPR